MNIVKRRLDKPLGTLVVDIGGSHVKCAATDRKRPVKFESGAKWTPDRIVVVSVGYPGVVRRGRIACEPHNLGKGWIGFSLGLGTGLGSALIVDVAIAAIAFLGGFRLWERRDPEAGGAGA